jgi:hypothetical protein
LIFAILLSLTSFLVAQREPRTDTATSAGLAFLAKQQADDGSFNSPAPKLAMTGLSLLSFLSSAQAQDVGRHGLTVRRAVDFLVKSVPDDGNVGRIDGSRMFGQAITTLALAEAFGVEPDPQQRAKIHAATARAVAVIVKAQDVAKPDPFAGGWGYDLQSADSDLLTTGWCVLSLRAAGNIGIDVPKTTINRALGYVTRCYRAENGGFAPQPQSEVLQASTGMGVLLLGLLDASDRPEVAAAGPLLSKPIDNQTPQACCTTYVITQATLFTGELLSPTVTAASRDQLLARQSVDGGWPQARNDELPGRIYSTAMAVWTLTTPLRVLPVYQR